MINVNEVKKKILGFLDENGPALPVIIGKKIELSPIFTSAILSELVNERRLKMSSLKVGSSPLYFLPGQEEKLENFQDNITGMEKEALMKLKKEKTLDDEEQETTIRVALRSLKDFAIAEKKNEKIIWRYAFTPEEEIEQKPEPKKETPVQEKQEETTKKPEEQKEKAPPKMENILDVEKPTKSKKTSPNEKFLEEIREFIERKNIELKVIEEYSKKQVFARVKMKDESYLLVAFDKKRVTNLDLLKAYKKAATLGIPYYVLCRGEPTKKLQEEIRAHKSLLKIDMLE